MIGLLMLACAGWYSPCQGEPPPPYTIVTQHPFVLRSLIDETLAIETPDCHFQVMVADREGSYAASDGADYCAIVFALSEFDLDDMEWWAPHVVRHEIAHLLTRDEPEDHGPRFRSVLAVLLAPLDIREEYGMGEYPARIYLHERLVYEEKV